MEVMSPVRKANSMKVHSRVTRQSVDSNSPELDYQNMLPRMGIGEWGDGNESTTAGNLLTVKSPPSHNASKSPPTARDTDQSRAESKSPVHSGGKMSPLAHTEHKSPVIRAQNNTPVPQEHSRSPVSRDKSKSPKPKVKPKPTVSPRTKPLSKSTEQQTAVRVQLVSSSSSRGGGGGGGDITETTDETTLGRDHVSRQTRC